MQVTQTKCVYHHDDICSNVGGPVDYPE